MEDIDLHLETADRLLHSSRVDEAILHVRSAQDILKQTRQTNEPRHLHMATIAGLLIDCGSLLFDKSLIQEGLSLFENNFENFSNVIQSSSLYYDIGNGYMALHDSEFISKKEFIPREIEILISAKNNYWKAYQTAKGNFFGPELPVNLGNSLDQCARVVEALMWYNEALKLDPQFGMAHLNRGEALLFLNRVSDKFAIAQLVETKHAFEQARMSGQLSPSLMDRATDNIKRIDTRLSDYGWNKERLSQEEAEHEHIGRDNNVHSPFWQFCLKHYLALNEHALYCHCVVSGQDDLSILAGTSTSDEFSARYELILGRLKSEFTLARFLFIRSIHGEQDYDLTGIMHEYLRTSFRLCFGVLDRIAQGLNELYNFAGPQEKLYYESFWRPQKERKDGNEKRWNKINQQINNGMVALYSIATDLNTKGGQWGFFKEYRNDLEHGLLFLSSPEAGVISKENLPKHIRYEIVDVEEFKTQTLHMLQLTASAILSFVFCVRQERHRLMTKNPSRSSN